MKSLVDGPFHLATIILADHQLIMRVLHHDYRRSRSPGRHENSSYMNLDNRSVQMNLVVKTVVTMTIVYSWKMFISPKVVTTTIHLSGSMLVKAVTVLG
jgi:uncharacterized membrane protein YedE/YeeE